MTSALIISAIISYLLGSLNFGIIISKSLSKDDVRSHGSGNAGSTNMLRNYGKKHAVMTIIGDMLKVAVAIFISFVIVRKMGNISLAENGGALILGIDARMFTKSFAGLFCVLGHIFPCFFGFKGGKGVATSLGVVLMLDWKVGLIVAVVAIAVMAVTRYVSLGSILGGAMYIVIEIVKMIVTKSVDVIQLVCVVIIGGLLIARHHANIKRLLSGTENKLGAKKGEVK